MTFPASRSIWPRAAEGMNYILGRNPLDKSYVTGYGERPLVNPHHRFWAHQANAAFPPPPPGVLSGGPNSGLQDPYVQAAGLAGCAPEKCFADNIEAWSANEVAINWNAPLAWVTAFLDEKAEVKAKPRPKAKDPTKVGDEGRGRWFSRKAGPGSDRRSREERSQRRAQGRDESAGRARQAGSARQVGALPNPGAGTMPTSRSRAGRGDVDPAGNVLDESQT